MNLKKWIQTTAPALLIASSLVAASDIIAISTTHAFQGNSGIGGEQGNANAAYTFGLWGDLPYSDVQANEGVPNLLIDMNSQKLAFTVHDGDLKAGSGSPCNDALYVRSLGYFNTLEAPAIFTPGDNDWTDCDRPANGGFSSLERLSHERQVFFSSPYTLGQRRFLQEMQSAPPPAPQCWWENPDHTRFSKPCVENRRWTYGRVTYATLNIQGSCNNLCGTNPDMPEYTARNAADIAWMQETFAVATARDSVAVMFIGQADPSFDKSDVTRAPLRDPLTLAETDGQPDGFQTFLTAFRTKIIDFRKPVAYVLVDPKSREVFAYQPQIVPANRVAVPAP